MGTGLHPVSGLCPCPLTAVTGFSFGDIQLNFSASGCLAKRNSQIIPQVSARSGPWPKVIRAKAKKLREYVAESAEYILSRMKTLKAVCIYPFMTELII